MSIPNDRIGGSAPFAVNTARIERNWLAITAELDSPRPAILERALRRIGVRPRITRLVVATPALRRAWYLAIGVAVIVGLGAVDPKDPVQSLFTLLVVAPLVPVLGVAFAYGPTADPAYEIQLATPMRGLRLVVVRSITVVAIAAVVITGTALLSPEARPMAAAWLLPALALTCASLAMMTALSPRQATTIVACAWLTLAFILRAAFDDALTAFRGPGQAVAITMIIACATVTVIRREHFDRLQVAS